MNERLVAMVNERISSPDLVHRRADEKAEALKIPKPTLYKIMMNPEADVTFETAIRVIEACGGDISRAFPDYVPVPEQAESILARMEKFTAKAGRKATVPIMFVDSTGASAVREREPVKYGLSQLEELTLDMDRLRRQLEEMKQQTLSPKATAPRSAIYESSTGRIFLDKCAPVDDKHRAITSADGIEQLLALTKPRSWADTKGPIIIAQAEERHFDMQSHESIQGWMWETLTENLPGHKKPPPSVLVLREPRDSAPRSGMVAVLTDPEDRDSLALRRIVKTTKGELRAQGLAPDHTSFRIDPKKSTVVARLVARLP